MDFRTHHQSCFVIVVDVVVVIFSLGVDAPFFFFSFVSQLGGTPESRRQFKEKIDTQKAKDVKEAENEGRMMPKRQTGSDLLSLLMNPKLSMMLGDSVFREMLYDMAGIDDDDDDDDDDDM